MTDESALTPEEQAASSRLRHEAGMIRVQASFFRDRGGFDDLHEAKRREDKALDHELVCAACERLAQALDAVSKAREFAWTEALGQETRAEHAEELLEQIRAEWDALKAENARLRAEVRDCHQYVDEAKLVVKQAEARCRDLALALAAIEWVEQDEAPGVPELFCPECANQKWRGHQYGCVLGTLLARPDIASLLTEGPK